MPRIEDIPANRAKLSRELSVALLVKFILLAGVWFLVFRPGGHERAPQPDISARFQLPGNPGPATRPIP